MMAPMPERLSRSTASATSSATSLVSMRLKKRVTPDCPRCASAARSSGAKSTTAAMGAKLKMKLRIVRMTVSLASHAAT